MTAYSGSDLPPPAEPARPAAPRDRLTARPRRGSATRTILALILREMSTRYGKTPGGYIWAILEPLGAIMILSVGFSLLFRTPPLGASFLLFYATGYLPFNLYQTLSNMIGRTIGFSRQLLQYPAVTWVDAIIARFLLNSLTGLLVSAILLIGIGLTLNTGLRVDLNPVIEAMALAMLLGLGVGTLNCALIGLFPVWDIVWSVITRPLFLASGILFLYDSMPATLRGVIWYNPLLHIIGLVREGFYPNYTASYVSPWFVIGCALVTMTMGLLLLRRHARDILTNR